MEKQHNKKDDVIDFDHYFNCYVRPWRIAVNKVLKYYAQSSYYKNFGKERQSAFLSFFSPVLEEPFATVVVGVGMECQESDFISPRSSLML
jgi:hypothetical protein